MAIASQLMGGGLPAEVARAICGTVASGLTAAGTTGPTALALGAAVNAVSTAASGTGVILPSGASKGDSLLVYNGGANTINVFPPAGGTINNLSADTAVTIATTKSALYICTGALTWVAAAGA